MFDAQLGFFGHGLLNMATNTNPKQSVINEMSDLLDALKEHRARVVKRCVELSKEHGVPFRLDHDEYGSAYFPQKINREALVGTEFDWLNDYSPEEMPYEGDGWSSSYC